MADTYTVAIVVDGNSYSVVPSDLLAKPGDQVTFKAVNTAALIAYDNQNLFRQSKLELKAGEQTTFTIQQVAAGPYPYTVSTPTELLSPTRARVIIYS